MADPVLKDIKDHLKQTNQIVYPHSLVEELVNVLCIVALHTQVWIYLSFCILLLMVLEIKLKYTEVHNKYRKGFSEISSVSITVSLISNNSVELNSGNK